MRLFLGNPHTVLYHAFALFSPTLVSSNKTLKVALAHHAESHVLSYTTLCRKSFDQFTFAVLELCPDLCRRVASI